MFWTLELASHLEDAPWPATKDELIDYAIRSGAPIEEMNIVATLTNRSNAAATVVIGDIEVFVPLAGLIDLDAERQRLSKELTAAQIDAERRRIRLADETFVGKAPVAIVQRERDSLAAVDAQIARLQQRLVDYSN